MNQPRTTKRTEKRNAKRVERLARKPNHTIRKTRINNPQLFHLAEDIAEKKNVIGSERDIAKELEALRLQWGAQLMEPRFLGLIHTDAWKKKAKKEAAKRN